MKDNLNEYNVTCYVTVAVTVRGVRAATPAHAAMSAALSVTEEPDMLGDTVAEILGQGTVNWLVDGQKAGINAEICDEIDGFLVETVGGEEAVRLNKNGERT